MSDVLLQSAYVLQLPSTGGFASIPAINAYQYGTADFTIETWINSTQGGPLVGFVAGSAPNLTLSCGSDGRLIVSSAGSPVLTTPQGAYTLDGSWHHVAIVRASSTLTIYLDGVAQTSGAGGSINVAGITAVRFGADGTSPNPAQLTGRFAEVRLWNVARTQAEITSQMFYRIDPTPALIGYWTFTNQSLADSSSNQNNGGSIVGMATYQFTKITHTWSFYGLGLTGAVPYVDIPGNASYNVGTGDFTFETWANVQSAGTILKRALPGVPVGTLTGFSIDCAANGFLNCTVSDGTQLVIVRQDPTSAPIMNAWHHVALTRTSNTITLYIDGVAAGTAQQSATLSIDVPLTVPLTLGTETLHAIWVGHALAGSTDAPPLPVGTSPFGLQLCEVRCWNAARTQDQLYRSMLNQLHGDEPSLTGYWNFNTANIVDTSPTRNLVVVANGVSIIPNVLAFVLPQFVLQLPGSSQSYCTVPSNDAFNFKATDFTVEARFKATAPGTIVDRPFVTTQPSCGIRARATATALEFIIGDGSTTTTYTAQSSLLDGAWHHIAWVRSSGSMKLFVDDAYVVCTPAPSLQTIQSVAPLAIGAHYDPSSSAYSDALTGSIDYVYLWPLARTLTDLQRTSFETIANLNETVGAWTFDQQAPIDQSPTGANGVLGTGASIVGDHTLDVEAPLSIVCLSGSNSALDCGTRADLSFGGAQAYTVLAWVKPAAASATGTVFSYGDPTTGQGYRVRLQNGLAVAQRASQGGTLTGVSPLNSGNWYCIAATFDGTTQRLYVNGALEASVATGAITAAANVHALIGASPASQGVSDALNGCVQNVAVWGRALDQASIQGVMFTWLTGTETDLRASWNFLYATSRDWTGTGPDAIFANAAYQTSTLAGSQMRRVLTFNGTGEYVDCGSGRTLNASAQMTLETWMQVTAFETAWQPIVSKGSVYEIRRYNNTNQITFTTKGLSAEELPSTVGTSVADGRWHHIAAVFDGANKYLYIDGILNATVAATGNIAVGNGNLYVTTNDGELMVIDAETGNAVWTQLLFQPIQTSPAVANNIICVSSPTGNIFAFDSDTRTRLWDAPIPPGAQVPLAIHRDVVYYSGAGTVMSAIDLATGRALWSMNGMANPYPPVFSGTTAYYGAGMMLTSRDLATQKVNWVLSMPDDIVGSPVLGQDVAFVNCADKNVYVVGLVGTPQIIGNYALGSVPVGSPVYKNGSVYSASSAGLVVKLTYSAYSQSLDLVWQTALGTALASQFSVDEPYLGAIGVDNALYSLDTTTGTLSWRYAKGSAIALSGLTVANGAAYFSSSDLQYNALDIVNKRVLWTTAIQATVQSAAAVSYAPFCIGASVDAQGRPSTAGTFHGQLSEMRLWAVARSAGDIATTWQRSVVGDEPGLAGYWACSSPPTSQEIDLSRHINTGNYVGTLFAIPSDLAIQPPLPRILAQSNMIQQWSKADVAADNIDGSVAFRTEITLLDGNGQALVGSGIKVFTDEQAVIEIDGVAYTVDNQVAAQVATNVRGMITVVTKCDALTTPTLQIWTDFIPVNERVIIHPDETLSQTLSTLSGTDLKNPSASKNPFLNGKQPLLPSLTDSQASNLASAINNAILNVKTPTMAPSRYALSHRRSNTLGTATLAGSVPGPGDVQSDQITLPGSLPYTRTVGAGPIPDWQFDYQTYTFSPMSSSEAGAFHTRLLGEQSIKTSDGGFSELWDWFVNGVKAAAKVVITVIEAGVQLVVQWVDSTIQTLVHVFETVQQVGEAVFGLFKQALGAAVDAAKKIYRFFAFLFNWDDILSVKNTIVNLVKQTGDNIDRFITDFIAQEQQFFDTLESQADAAMDAFIGRLGSANLATVRGLTPEVNPLISGSNPQGGPQLQTSARFAATVQQSETFGVEGNWLLSNTLGSSSGVSGFGAPGFGNDLQQQMNDIFEYLRQQMNSSKAVAAFERAFDYFRQIGSNPQSFTQLLVKGVLEALRGIVDLSIEIARTVVTMLLEGLKAMFDTMMQAMTATIDIPVVSWLYEKVSGSKLSLLDFLSLVVAIPTAVVYKAISGQSPPVSSAANLPSFAPDGMANGRAQASATASFAANANALTPFQKLRYTAAGISQLLGGLIGGVNELADLVNDTGASSTVFNVLNYVGYGLTLIGVAAFVPEYIAMLPGGALTFTLLLLALVPIGFGLYLGRASVKAGATALLKKVPLWALQTIYGCVRLIGLFILYFLTSIYTTADFVRGLFEQLPNACKWLRKAELVAESEGLTLIILMFIDMLGGTVAGSVRLYSTWSAPDSMGLMRALPAESALPISPTMLAFAAATIP